MAVLTVGSGQQYTTIASAIAAAHDGDTLDVQAGTYRDDFATITKNINLVGVGGMVHMVADKNIPNGKAILVIDANVAIDHFEFSGAQVVDGNGAGIRYEAGNLTITNSYFHNNQEGILTAPVTNGTLSIDHSEFAYNGTGDGLTHDVYVGHIGTFSLTNSYIHDANVGHEVKSRAATTIIANNRIFSNGSSDSYNIDLPNGGVASIHDNIIQQGAKSQNGAIISYGEEGSVPANSFLEVNNNVIVNQLTAHPPIAVVNRTSFVANIAGNQFFGLTAAQVANGPNAQTGDSFLSSSPALDSSTHPWSGGTVAAPPPAPSISSFGADSGMAGDHITNATSLTLTGNAAANSTVKVFDGTSVLGSAAANGAGAWTYTTAALSGGAHAFTATATDGAGHISGASSVFSVTIDTTAPVAPLIASFSPDTGTVGDHITSATTLTVTGTAEPGSTVKVADGATLLGSAAANGSGVWAYTTAALSGGAHAFTATATDAAGNTSAASTAFKLTVDFQAATASSATVSQVGKQFRLADTSTSQVLLSYHESPFIAGQLGSWTPIGAGRTSTGFDVVLKASSDQYSVWSTDASGNYVATLIGAVSGASAALQRFEGTFQQDFNRDGHIGSAVIESSGSISLSQGGNNFAFSDNSGSQVILSYHGSPFVVGQLGSWTAIAAEKTSTGYDVALKAVGDQYSIWATDTLGNYVGTLIGAMSGSSAALQRFEATFQQDLNGDGHIASPLIESSGSTWLSQSGNNFAFSDSSGSQALLSYHGSPFVVGELGNWAPIAAERTSTGYDVILKTSGDQYSVWSTDVSGNYAATLISAVSGSSAGLQRFEAAFQQDFNGDRHIASPLIESFGSTSLSQSGNNFAFTDSSGSQTQLSYHGSAFVVGQLGSWTPIAAEKTSSGYDVALKAAGDQYSVWSTDTVGNYVGTLISAVSGSSPELQRFEATFQQDLNADGHVGSALIESSGSTSLSQSGNNFAMTDSSGSQVLLSYHGSAFVVGEMGSWTPIAAEKTSTGYDVAMKAAGDQYSVWATDTLGNYARTLISAVAASSSSLQAIETTFHQDLNKDGVIGLTLASAH